MLIVFASRSTSPFDPRPPAPDRVERRASLSGVEDNLVSQIPSACGVVSPVSSPSFYLTSLLNGSDPCASTNTGGSASVSSSSSSSKISNTIASSSTAAKTTASSSSLTKTTMSASSSSTTKSTSVKTTATVISTTSSTSTASTKPSKTASSSSTKSAASTKSSTPAAATASAVSCPASNSTTYISNGKSFLIECGIDHTGGDLSMVSVNSLKQCIDTCATTTGCVDVSLSGVACYMKSSVGKALYNAVHGAKLLTTTATTPTPSSTTKTSSLTTSTCTPASTVSVSFNHNVTTAWLESIKLIGSIAELGKWNTSQAVAMSAAGYTTDNPIWNATVKLVAGTYLEYKFIKVDSDGGVTWEVDPNRNYTVPRACSGTGVVESEWQ